MTHSLACHGLGKRPSVAILVAVNNSPRVVGIVSSEVEALRQSVDRTESLGVGVHLLALAVGVYSRHGVAVAGKLCDKISHGCGLQSGSDNLLVRMAHNGVGERLHVYISSHLALCGLLPRKDNVLLVRTEKLQVCHRRGYVVADEQTCSHLSTVAHAVCGVSGVVVNGSLHVAQVVNILHLLSGLCVCYGSNDLMVTQDLYVCDGRKILSVKRLCRVCPRHGSLCCSVVIGHNLKVVKSSRCALCRSRERNVETAELRQRTDDSH